MNYADDKTLHVFSENVDVILENLVEIGRVLFQWFSNNFLKANVDKCHRILSTDEPFIGHEVIKNSNDKELLKANLNNRLSFDIDEANICNQVRKVLYALAKISNN